MNRNVGNYLFNLKQANTTSFQKNCAPRSTGYEVWSSCRKKGHDTTSEISHLISLVKNFSEISDIWTRKWWAGVTRIIFEKWSIFKWWMVNGGLMVKKREWVGESKMALAEIEAEHRWRLLHVWDFLKFLQVPKRSFASRQCFMLNQLTQINNSFQTYQEEICCTSYGAGTK